MKRAICKTVFWMLCKLMLGLLFVTLLRTLEKQYAARAEREECCMNMTFTADRDWREGHHNAALDAYRRADALCPEDLLARYRMAQAYVHMRQTDRATAEYRYILARELPEGLAGAGRAHFELGSFCLARTRRRERGWNGRPPSPPPAPILTRKWASCKCDGRRNNSWRAVT